MPAENSKRSGFLIPLVILFTIVILFQGYNLRRLQQETLNLRKEIANLQGIEKKHAAASGPLNPEELESLRQSKSELQRLRGQFAVLRKQLQDPPDQKTEEASPSPGTPKPEPFIPVRTFTTTTHAQLKPDEIMVTGGWSTQTGKSTWIIVSPSISGRESATPNVITVEQKIVEVPDQVAGKLGLAELRTTQNDTTQNGIFDGDQAEVFWKELEESDGVDLLSSPKISTVSGRSAQVSALQSIIIDGQQYNLGPTVEIVPTILDNGSLKLTLTGRVTLRMEKTR